MTDLTEQTPVEIDTALAALYDIESGLVLDAQIEKQRLYTIAGATMPGEKPRTWGEPQPVLTIDEVLAAVTEKAAATWGGEYAQSTLDRYQAALDALRANKAEQEPLTAEYHRRGRWTRAFLVLNTGGHVHSSMHCGTCFPTTRYGWLPSLSGHDEAEIVEAAGADACTVCYPSAPVESLSRPRSIRHHTEDEAAKARAAREQAKADRAAAKAAKAITSPDGSPLRVFDWRVPERQVRERDGSVRVIEAHDRYEVIETAHAAKAWLTDSRSPHYGKRADDVQRVAEALAVKHGTSPEQEITAAAKRYAKRR